MAEDIISLRCCICDLLCDNKSTLLGHLETHEAAPVACLGCKVTFSNVHSFDYHKIENMCSLSKLCASCVSNPDKKKQCVQCSKNKVKSRTCLQCNKTFRFRRHYDKHIEGHRRNNCRYCSALLTNRKELVIHMAEKHQIKLQEAEYQCEFCEKRFVKRVTLYNHYNQHANGQFVCLCCGMFLKTEEEFLSHKEEHNQNKQWKCERCEETFIRRQQYLVHMKGHEKYQCMACGESFAVKNKLLEHERHKHELRRVERCHQCPTCGHAFSRPGLLELHYRIHTGEKPVQCKECNKNFRTPRGYLKHLGTTQHIESLRTPSLIKLFKCDKCDKCFNQKPVLEKHKNRVHGNGQSFNCEFCDHKSNCKENMKRHVALHTEKRQFICEQCGAAFHALQALKDHTKYVHSQTRDYTCAQCGKSFKRNSGLNRHMATHSESRPFVCDCGQSYKRASHLRRHKESVHGVVIKSEKLVRLEHDVNTGALVPVVDEFKPTDVKKNCNSTTTTTTTTTTETQWQATATKTNTENTILTLVSAEEFPRSKEELKVVAAEFKKRWQFINCGGALDGKHIQIVPPSYSGALYYNYKKLCSVILLALVSANYEFIDIDVGKQGRMSDAGVLECTSFFERMKQDKLNFPPNEENDYDLNFFITKDEHFFKLYPQKNLSYDRYLITDWQEHGTLWNMRLVYCHPDLEFFILL